jgi:hypothetical protein
MSTEKKKEEARARSSGTLDKYINIWRITTLMSALRKFSGNKGEAGAYKVIVFDELTVALRLGGGVAAAGKIDISR